MLYIENSICYIYRILDFNPYQKKKFPKHLIDKIILTFKKY